MCDFFLSVTDENVILALDLAIVSATEKVNDEETSQLMVDLNI